jgi:hypothetical protein
VSIIRFADHDLTDYPRRLRQLNGLFAAGETSFEEMEHDLLVYYLTTLLLWHETEHEYDIDAEDWLP